MLLLLLGALRSLLETRTASAIAMRLCLGPSVACCAGKLVPTGALSSCTVAGQLKLFYKRSLNTFAVNRGSYETSAGQWQSTVNSSNNTRTGLVVSKSI